jgi:hypothetical protein
MCKLPGCSICSCRRLFSQLQHILLHKLGPDHEVNHPTLKAHDDVPAVASPPTDVFDGTFMATPTSMTSTTVPHVMSLNHLLQHGMKSPCSATSQHKRSNMPTLPTLPMFLSPTLASAASGLSPTTEQEEQALGSTNTSEGRRLRLIRNLDMALSVCADGDYDPDDEDEEEAVQVNGRLHVPRRHLPSSGSPPKQ